MPSVPINVQPAVLDWVMQKAIAENVDNTVIDSLIKWISGEKTPTFNQLEGVSKKVGIPFGYFFLKEPPVEKCDLVEYRTVDSISLKEPSRDLIDTIDMMSGVQEWMINYNKNNGASAYSFVGAAKASDDIIATANTIKKHLGLSLTWFDNYSNATEAFKALRNAIMNLGVLVMMNGVVGNNTHRALNVQEFRAFTLVDPYAPLIFINSKDAENGKLFSLLHELVHIWIGKDSFYNDIYGTSQNVSKEEQFCNAVAAEILVPDSEFSTEWAKHKGSVESSINELEKRFICSRFVLLRKALDNGKVDQAQYRSLLALYQKQVKALMERATKTSGGDFYRTLSTKWDQRFIQALYTSAQSGITQYRDVYRLTNTTGKTFHEIAERAGVV